MPQESIHQEIKWLEEQLEAKKREMSEKGEQKDEREAVREVIKEKARQESPVVPTALPEPKYTNEEALRRAEELQEKEHENVIEELVALAFSKSLMTALKVAESLNNAHIMDDFHGALAGKYYEKLLESRKIPS